MESSKKLIKPTGKHGWVALERPLRDKAIRAVSELRVGHLYDRFVCNADNPDHTNLTWVRLEVVAIIDKGLVLVKDEITGSSYRLEAWQAGIMPHPELQRWRCCDYMVPVE